MQLDQITFTRFIAALTVVFFHYGQSIFPANVSFLYENVTAGPIAVGYFYVLSGFIMAIAYYQTDKIQKGNFNKAKYWIARFARIYPVYLLALLIIAAAKFKTLGEDWASLPLHLSLLQSWIPGYPITLNTPGWSLSVEAFFYLCFPFLLIWIYKHGIKSLTLFAVALIMFLLIWGRPHLETLFGLKLAFTNGLLAPAFLAVIIFLASHKGIITKIFTYPFLILLGEASYSLYILQKPVYGIYDKVIVPRIDLSATIHFYIFVILLIIISILSYKFFETPMRKWINKKFSSTS